MSGVSTTPRATAIIVTRDRPVLLREALAAIDAQDVDGVVETIVVFDQSAPDHSLERTDGPRPVRVVGNQRTPGLPGGRNTGASLARGPVLAFCDDDDTWMPDKLRRQLELLEDHPEVDVVVTGILVDFDGRETHRPGPERITFADLLRSRIMEANFVTAAVRRSAFWDRIGPASEDLPGGYGEDYEWMLRAARHGDVLAIPEPLARINWHGSSYFSSRWQVIDDALEQLLEDFPEFQDEPAGLARILGQRAFAKAASGRRREALAMVRRTLASSPREPRAYLATVVALRLISPDRVRLLLHRFGRGI